VGISEPLVLLVTLSFVASPTSLITNRRNKARTFINPAWIYTTQPNHRVPGRPPLTQANPWRYYDSRKGSTSKSICSAPRSDRLFDNASATQYPAFLPGLH